jgi:hypothetical protein
MHSVTNAGQIKTRDELQRFDRAELSLSAPVTITISDTTNYFPLEHANLQIAHAYNFAISSNRLTYTGTEPRLLWMMAAISMTCAGNSQLLYMQWAENGSDLSQTRITRKIGSGTDEGAAPLVGMQDVGAAPLVGMHTISANDYVAVEFRNSTTTANITVEQMNATVFAMPV